MLQKEPKGLGGLWLGHGGIERGVVQGLQGIGFPLASLDLHQTSLRRALGGWSQREGMGEGGTGEGEMEEGEGGRRNVGWMREGGEVVGPKGGRGK